MSFAKPLSKTFQNVVLHKVIPNIIFDRYMNSWFFKKQIICNCRYYYLFSLNKENTNIERLITPEKIEKHFFRASKEIRPIGLVNQGDSDCALAALSMLTRIEINLIRKSANKYQDKLEIITGFEDDCLSKICNEFSIKLVEETTIGNEPCIFSIPSININNGNHKLYWDGKKVLDPNFGLSGRNWWGPEWHPLEMGKNITGILTLKK